MEYSLEEMLEYLTWLRAQDFSASAFRLEIQRKQEELRHRQRGEDDDKEPE